MRITLSLLRIVVAGCCIFIGIAETSLSAQVALFEQEIQVNANTASSQLQSSCTISPDGNSVVVWQSNHVKDDVDYGSIYGQRFDNDGQRIGGEFLVNTQTKAIQRIPIVDSDRSGNFVVVWMTIGRNVVPGIYAQRFDRNGIKLGGEFQISDAVVDQSTGEYIVDIQLAVSPNGRFVVGWQSSRRNLYFQLYDGNGDALSNVEQVGKSLKFIDQGFDIDINSEDDLILGFTGILDVGGNTLDGVFVSKHPRGNISQSQVTYIDSMPGYNYRFRPNRDPRVSINDSGRFVITWNSILLKVVGARAKHDVFAKYCSLDGATIRETFRVNTNDRILQNQQDVAINDNGEIVFTWINEFKDGISENVYMRLYDSSGSHITDEILVNSYTNGRQEQPAISVTDSKIIISWNTIHVLKSEKMPNDLDSTGIYFLLYSY